MEEVEAVKFEMKGEQAVHERNNLKAERVKALRKLDAKHEKTIKLLTTDRVKVTEERDSLARQLQKVTEEASPHSCKRRRTRVRWTPPFAKSCETG